MKNYLVFLLSVIAFTLYSQEVTTFAGTGAIGSTDGPSADATFNNPHGIATDDNGTIYVADRYGHTIRKISNGVVTTLAGSGNVGSDDGNGTAASFYEPWGICVGQDGNVYVTDTKNNKIRKITPAGEVTTFAGNGSFGITDGPGATASFGYPTGIDQDAAGNFYVADHLTHIIRKISPDGIVSRLAGSPYCFGLVDGVLGANLFNRPYGLTVNVDGSIIVADEWNHAIRKVTQDGLVTTLAGNGAIGHDDASGDYATFNYPWDVAVDNSGNIFVMDGYNHSIRKLMAAPTSPISYSVLTFAGISEESGWVDGYGTEAKFNGAAGISYCKSSEEIFIADTYNNRVRKIIDHHEQSVLLQLVTNSQGVICTQENCTALAYPSNFDTYIFFINGQIVQSGANEEFVTSNLPAGTHSVSVHAVNSSGSYISNEFSFDIVDTPTPVIGVVGDLPMPQSSAVVLKTDEGIAQTWSDGSETEFITVDEPGVFTVDVLYESGCIGTSEPVNVQQYCNVEAPIIEFATDNEIGDCLIGSAKMQTDFAADNIQWICDGVPIPGANAQEFEAFQTAAFQIVATVNGQEVYSNVLFAHISAPILEDITANKTTIFESSPKVNFKAELFSNYGDYSYEWNFGDVNSGDDNFAYTKKPKHTFSGIGVYSITLTVTDLNTGCSQTMYRPDMIIYGEEFGGGNGGKTNEEHIIFVPNAFSPNGDGENDVLYVRGEEIVDLEFNVYNKKGKLLFKSTDKAVGWDGNANGKPAENETYNYLVKATMSNGDVESKTGKVFIIK